jgi:hypothetical protein
VRDDDPDCEQTARRETRKTIGVISKSFVAADPGAKISPVGGTVEFD